MKTQTFNPEQEATLTYVPDFQDSTFTVTGLGEALLPIVEAVAEAPRPAAKAVEVPVVAVQVQNQYTDLSELPSRQIARMKLRSRVYDMIHRTNMTELLTERINEDRDVAFARSLGLVGVTHCQKHEKAVAKLRQLV
jgi:hypothetical protein